MSFTLSGHTCLHYLHCFKQYLFTCLHCLVILVLVCPWKLILMLPNVFYIDPAKAKYIESPVCRGIRIEYEINCLFGKNGILAVHIRLMSFPSRALVTTTFDKLVKAGAVPTSVLATNKLFFFEVVFTPNLY